jgi:hypothetical protein
VPNPVRYAVDNADPVSVYATNGPQAPASQLPVAICSRKEKSNVSRCRTVVGYELRRDYDGILGICNYLLEQCPTSWPLLRVMVPLLICLDLVIHDILFGKLIIRDGTLIFLTIMNLQKGAV